MQYQFGAIAACVIGTCVAVALAAAFVMIWPMAMLNAAGMIF